MSGNKEASMNICPNILFTNKKDFMTNFKKVYLLDKVGPRIKSFAFLSLNFKEKILVQKNIF